MIMQLKLLMKLSLLSRYQIGLETLVRGRDFVFDSVELLYHKCHKINFKCGGSYIDSPNWIKNKKAIINPKNEDDKCFLYAATVALTLFMMDCSRMGGSI